MHIRITCRRLLLFGLTALLLYTLGMAPHPSSEVHLWELLSAPSSPDQPQITRQPWVIRAQKIRLHQTILDMLRDPKLPVPSGIILDLTSDTSHEMVIDSKTPGALSTTIIQGHAQKVAHSDIILVIKARSIAGTIRMDTRVFRIQSTGDNEHLLVEINPEKLPPD
ncbi:MAG: hypothetical protein CAF44_015005 [Nitrospira sp. CG24D]|nr:MAG: hypothetical protein CAF44_015005 [Nitrospira sp. CG24D]